MASLLVMFGNRTIPSISEPDVERYKVWRLTSEGEIEAVKGVTLRHDQDNFSKFFNWANKMGYATRNPVDGVERPSIEDAVRMYILIEKANVDLIARTLSLTAESSEVLKRRVQEADPSESKLKISANELPSG